MRLTDGSRVGQRRMNGIQQLTLDPSTTRTGSTMLRSSTVPAHRAGNSGVYTCGGGGGGGGGSHREGRWAGRRW